MLIARPQTQSSEVGMYLWMRAFCGPGRTHLYTHTPEKVADDNIDRAKFSSAEKWPFCFPKVPCQLGSRNFFEVSPMLRHVLVHARRTLLEHALNGMARGCQVVQRARCPMRVEIKKSCCAVVLAQQPLSVELVKQKGADSATLKQIQVPIG